MIIFFISTIYFSCSNNKTTLKRTEGYYRGEKIYRTICITCHNVNPNKIGGLAPDIADSNLETIRSMIMTGKLPKGQKSKWPDMGMVPLPHLEDEIPYLFEYINSFKK